MNILIVGWFNSNVKHLNKYKAMYQKLGYENINLYTYPLKTAVTHKGWIDIHNDKTNHNLNYDLVHSLSGGSLLYYNLCNLNLKNSMIIYDSAPMFATPMCVSNYIVESYNQPKFFIPMYQSIVNNYWKIEKQILPNKDEYNYIFNKQNYNNIIFDDNKDTLILNDKSDKIVLHEEIDKNTENLQNVRKVYIENSEHVQHLRYASEQYISTINEFLK